MYPTATTLFATTRRKSDSTMKPATVTWRFSALVATILFFSSISRRIEASGVFELEFIKFELLDLPPRLASENLDHPMHRTNESHHPSHEAAPKNPLQVFVCLKPAFTSQLDGPCTYGNASTTLIKESSVVIQDPPLTTDLKQQVPDQQGYLATNLVRIPFTFRWTVSSISFSYLSVASFLLPLSRVHLSARFARSDFLSSSPLQKMSPHHQAAASAAGRYWPARLIRHDCLLLVK